MNGMWREGDQDAQRGPAGTKDAEAAKDRDARKPRGKLTLRYGAGR